VTPATSRWLAPLGASAAVLAVVVMPGVLATTGGGGLAPDQVFVPNDPVTPSLPTYGPDTHRSGRGVEIVGYQAMGRTLHVFYTLDQTIDCSNRIQTPNVEEHASTVVVKLSRRPSAAPDQVCQPLRLTNSVEIVLSRPMGGRLLQDGARGRALVPIERPFRSDVKDTIRPPDSRAGR
jgi:hypothetical protein